MPGLPTAVLRWGGQKEAPRDREGTRNQDQGVKGHLFVRRPEENPQEEAFWWLIKPPALTAGKKYTVKARVTVLVDKHGAKKRVVKTLKGQVSVC